MRNMVQRAVASVTLFVAMLAKLLLLQRGEVIRKQRTTSSSESENVNDDVEGYGLSWRLAVEANNVSAWRTVPPRCFRHVQRYMMGGQYREDLRIIADQILGYARHVPLSHDGFDAWILDVDDTCISNLGYYKTFRFGCDPFDSAQFKAWIMKGGCPAIPEVLILFKKLIETGFKVFLLTGRDEATLGNITVHNLHSQGFVGYHRLILKSREYKGQSAVKYKSDIRKKIEEEGYRIWGNVGDQWSDLQGYSLGNRTFKIPNPIRSRGCTNTHMDHQPSACDDVFK